MSTRTLRIMVDGQAETVHVPDNPLGWRWWRWTEWRNDGWVPMTDHRVIPIARSAHAWLCALEQGGFRTIAPFSLFPIVDQDPREAAAFAERLFLEHAREPVLL